MPSTSRRFRHLYDQSLWTAHSGEAFTHRVCPGDRYRPRNRHPKVDVVGRSSHTQGYREPFAQSPAAIGYDVEPSSPTAPAGGPCDGKLVGDVIVPPPKNAKGNEKRTPKKVRTPGPESSHRNPSPQGDSGVVSVSQPPDHSQQAEQPAATPMPQLCRREVVSDSRESKAAAKG